jgi:hypothetical protein
MEAFMMAVDKTLPTVQRPISAYMESMGLIPDGSSGYKNITPEQAFTVRMLGYPVYTDPTTGRLSIDNLVAGIVLDAPLANELFPLIAYTSMNPYGSLPEEQKVKLFGQTLNTMVLWYGLTRWAGIRQDYALNDQMISLYKNAQFQATKLAGDRALRTEHAGYAGEPTEGP